jgi:hypothetical protein
VPNPIVVESQQGIQALLALDKVENCALCDRKSIDRARDAIRALVWWWLSDTHRSLWRVKTVVEGRPTGASFKIECPGRQLLLPVFLVMCQHWERKKLPHYQLQVPHGSLGEGLEDAGIKQRVERLIETCDRETEKFREPGAKSIALQVMPALSDWAEILVSITKLVVGLSSINWADLA